MVQKFWKIYGKQASWIYRKCVENEVNYVDKNIVETSPNEEKIFKNQQQISAN